MEQTGSEVDCIGRTPRYDAWFEMYPGPSENYSNVVRPGDHFNAAVAHLSGDNFELYIADTTQHWSHTIKATLGQTPALSSAEAIVEAPCCTSDGGTLPLADFGTVSFNGAQANGSALGNARGLTEIVMVGNYGLAKDSISSLKSRRELQRGLATRQLAAHPPRRPGCLAGSRRRRVARIIDRGSLLPAGGLAV